MKTYNIYGVGNALVDFEYSVTESDLSAMEIDKGVMTLIDADRHDQLVDSLSNTASHKASGGSAANTVIAAAQLGARTYYSCKVASDDTGTFYMQDLQAANVDSNLSMDNREAGTTGKCIVMVTPDADRTMSTFLGITSQFGERELDPAAIADSEYLYMEGYLVTEDGARQAAMKAREIAEAAQVKTALTLSDPNMVQFFKDGLLAMAGDSLDLAFCNLSEAQLMFDCESVEDCAAGMRGLAKQFAITLGPDGALLFDGKDTTNVTAAAVEAVDSNGAGDMFAGVFLYGLTHGKSFRECGEMASKAASELVTRHGPRLDQAKLKEIVGV